ncbi:hypothetical protein ACHAAC_12355 [Aeromicrobium sp. CF4.19]|uniref:hypothetical protein n=1 Tax=Aeromicrobium sp. CF4.19 TaxID=3373082 RepID=UPI003EE7C7EC
MLPESRRLVVALLMSLAMICWAVPTGASPATGEPDVTTEPEVAGPTPTPRPAPEAPAPRSVADSADEQEPEPGEEDEESPVEEDPIEGEPVEDGLREVADAQLRWGLSNEVNNRAFAPGTFNFMSAGKIPDPGRGGVIMPPGQWNQQFGDVSIEKFSASSNTYREASWAGLRTDSSGDTIPSPTSGRFSNHQVVLDAGEGVIDTEKGTATIRWKGSFTVVLYSGMSFFYVSDPVLTVTNGTGRLTATLGGYGSSMEDMTKWEKLPDTVVRLADLGRVDVSSGRGVTVTPAYRGVRVDVPSDQAGQVRSGEHWGSFPQSFVNFQSRAGTASYWYSSGGAADPFKATLPMTLSWSAGDPVVPSAPSTHGADAADTVENVALEPPPLATAPPVGPAAAAGTTAPAVTVPPPGDLAPVADTPTTGPVSTVLAASISSGGDGWAWILGAILLVLAGAIASTPLVSRRAARTP